MKKVEIDRAKKYKSWRKKTEHECMALWQEIVKARAGYTCEFPNCFYKAPFYKMDAHHVFRKAVHRVVKYDPDNGMCLCVKHHTMSRECAHGDIGFKDKILGKKDGYKAVRTEQWYTTLERRAWTQFKPDLKLEKMAFEKELQNLRKNGKPVHCADF